MSITEQRDMKYASCRTRAEQAILSKYPQYKQLNIIRQGSGYAEKDLVSMNAFIDAVRARCDEYEAEIESADDPGSIVIDYSDIQP